jgi:PiT family inorganic phosphate transporter
MDSSFILITIVVVMALAFDFTNGFHDTANAMATTVATEALPPRVAVILAGALNFVGAFLSLKVAATIASGIVSSDLTTPTVVFAGLVGAIGWNLITWYFGLPSSSSHALIGGVVGATLVAVGLEGINGPGLLSKVLIPAVLAPLIACAVAASGTYLAYRVVRSVSSERGSRGYKWGQIGSASLVALAHGTNDAQKTMGIIVLALIGGGYLSGGDNFEVPLWVILSAATAIALGTAMGGWRIIRTLGNRVVDIAPPQGFGAETACAAVILSSAAVGFPLSTTHVVAGGVVGSGLGRFKSFSSVNWGVFGSMVVACWVLTLPGAALIAGIAGLGTEVVGGTTGVVIVAIVAVAGGIGVWLAAQRDPVTADNVNDVSPAEPALAAGGAV